MTDTAKEQVEHDGITRVEMIEEGPILVHGVVSIIGNKAGASRPNDPARPVAICRCGQSMKLPFCDDMHKLHFHSTELIGGELE